VSVARRLIASADLALPEIGFGAAPLGNLYAPVTDLQARATLDAALGSGMRYVDTAPHYGRGLSERRVGDALRLMPDTLVSTKVGRLLRPDPGMTEDGLRDGFRSPMQFGSHYDYTHDGILRSHEDSLQRLGLARVDLLFIHDIGVQTHRSEAPRYWNQLTAGGGFAALDRLRDEGAIAGYGLGVNEIPVCLDALAIARIDVILLAGRYTLLEQGALDELLPLCTETGTSVVIGGPYNSGILATGTRGIEDPFYDYAPAPDSVIKRVRAIETIGDLHGVDLPAAALQFVLAHPSVVSVIPGIVHSARVAETLALYRQRIPQDFWLELRAAGLIHASAPLPSPAPDHLPDEETTWP
jgi:D-threo-aldose 1-dehydrogenase